MIGTFIDFVLPIIRTWIAIGAITVGANVIGLILCDVLYEMLLNVDFEEYLKAHFGNVLGEYLYPTIDLKHYFVYMLSLIAWPITSAVITPLVLFLLIMLLLKRIYENLKE